MVEPIGEADLQAFVDGEIEPLRRFEVADYLANHPAQAAQVMADIRSSAALKILYGEARWHLADGTVGAARKLQHGLHGRRFGFWVARAAGVVALIGFFYFAHLKAGAFEIPDDQTGQPAFVVDAVHAYRTQLLLTHMTSMANMPDYDADEIRAVTEIVVPPLLPGIEVTNIQLVPTHARAGIDAMLQTESLNRIALFAVRADDDAVIPPTVSKSENETTIYWQQGSRWYALTGTDDEQPILQQLALNLSKEKD